MEKLERKANINYMQPWELVAVANIGPTKKDDIKLGNAFLLIEKPWND